MPVFSPGPVYAARMQEKRQISSLFRRKGRDTADIFKKTGICITPQSSVFILFGGEIAPIDCLSAS
jgi:hypothetical protein